MRSVIAFCIVAFCCIAVCSTAVIPTAEAQNQYDAGIDKEIDAAIKESQDQIAKENAQRSDIENVLANALRAPQAYENLVIAGTATLPEAIKLTTDGYDAGLKSNGATGAIRDSTFGLVSGLQLIYSNAIANVLKEGKDPKTDAFAAKISAHFDAAYKLALQKRTEEQKGKDDVEGTQINVEKLAFFGVLFAKNTVLQAIPLTQSTVQGIVDGFKKSLAGALGKGTTGLAYGVVNGFGQIDKDAMKLNKNIF